MRIFWILFANISIIMVFVLFWFLSIDSDGYKNNFHNVGMKNNIEYLKRTYGEKRIIMIGGSSLAFALSAEKLSEDLGIPTRSTGIAVGYGMKNIWAMYKDFLDPNKDIILLSPEYQMMEDLLLNPANDSICRLIYIRGSLKLLKENMYCTSFVAKELRNNLFVWLRLKNKENIGSNRLKFIKVTNEYGDIVDHYGKESTYSNKNGKRIDASILQGSKDAYIEFVKKNILEKGFRVIYVPVTIERSRIKGIEKEIEEVQSDLLKFFGGEKEDIKDIFLYDEQYFFDTEYHPTYEGRMKKHPQVKKIIERELKKGKVQKVL